MNFRASWAMVLVAIAALEFVPSYSGALPALVFAVAAIAPFVLVRLGAGARLGAVPAALLVVVGSLAAAWWALTRAGEGAGPAVFSDAVPRLLTSGRPAPVQAALLAPPALLVALVASVVAVCVFAPPPHTSARVGGVMAPTLGASVLYVGAQLLDAGRADRHGFVAMSLLLITVVSWSTPYRHGDDRVSMSWSPSVVAPAVGVVVLGLAAAAAVPATGAFEPRDHVTPPTVSLTESSPLTLLAAWGRNQKVEILRAKVLGTQRLRLATLSSFSGEAWQVDDSYTDFGAVGARELPAGERVQPVTADVSLTQLGGLWVPTPGGTTDTSLAGAVVDRANGGLARPEPVTAGLSYSVSGELDAPTQATLRAAPLADRVPARYLAVPHLPGGLAQYARESVRGASSPLEEAVALEDAVTTGRSFAPTAPTGSSYARLTTFLFGTAGRSGAQVGSSEQFAAAFAVLARAVGLPSRVVVGFIVPKPGADGSVVRGGNAEAWPEIYLAGAGWVPFEPTPGTGGASGDAGLKQAVLQRLKNNQGVVAAPSRQPRPTPTVPATKADSTDPSGTTNSVAVLLAIVVGLLVLIVVLLAALRWARTARHRRAGARGAWAEVLDLFVLLGRPAPRHVAAPELAAELDARLGQPGGAQLVATAADRAAFAPDAAGDATTSGVEVWRQVRVLKRRARSRLRWYRRAGFGVDPRPLLRRH